MNHSSDDNNDDNNDDGDDGVNSANSSNPPSNSHNMSPTSDNTPSFATDASPVSTLPPSNRNLKTPTHRTNIFTTEEIVALILQGDHQGTSFRGSPPHVNPINPINHSITPTPLIPELDDALDEGTEDDPKEDPTELLGDYSNSSGN
ncbi:hypothetical protein LIER_31521 [Lithospermum erythrorhizon]|uniref:Uncharacterized protein n=1 Tax=Lithospermum erythrorhizon TaxID=34254 RepID=A0AAV3RR91_LITER